MRCLQATQLISESQERALGLPEKIGLQTHLLTCPHCRNFQKNCRTLRKLMKGFANPPAPCKK